MANSIAWHALLSSNDKAIGEVANVKGGIFDIYIYPEFYPNINVGNIIVINAEKFKLLGIVLKLAHETRLGSFTPLRKSRNEINQTYPDLERYHSFVSTIVYTSHLNLTSEKPEIFHRRAGMPKLHDLAFIVKENDLLDTFFKPNGLWDFSFLKYYIKEGASIIEVNDLLYYHKDYIKSKINQDKKSFYKAFIKALIEAEIEDIATYMEILEEVLK
jgi:hypothetical protein